MNENVYQSQAGFYVFTEEGKIAISKDLNKLGAVYDGGAGWFIKGEYKHELETLCNKANLVYFDCLLPDNFEELRYNNKKAFFKDKLYLVDVEIRQVLHENKIAIDYISIDDLLLDHNRESIEKAPNGSKILTLLFKRNAIQKNITRLDNEKDIQRNHSAAYTPTLDIKFLYENPVNYLTTDAPEEPMILTSDKQPFLRKGITAMLVGAGGVGKTHFLTQLAMSVGTGKKFLDTFSIPNPGYVFMALSENSEEDNHRLIRKISKGEYSDDEILEASQKISIMSLAGKKTIFIEDSHSTSFYLDLKSSLKEKEPEEGWTLIILDPISRFLGVTAETDNASATQFIALLEHIISDLKGKPTVLFSHHMNKHSHGSKDTNQTAARGSSALTDGVRWQANLEKDIDKDELTLKVVKSNFTAMTEYEFKKNNDGSFYKETTRSAKNYNLKNK